MGYNYIHGTGSSDNNTFNKGVFHPSLNGTALADSIYGYDGNDILLGNDGDDDLAGHIGNDRLEGGKGNDELNGGSGNDILLGGSGEDELDGKYGNDILSGGAGPDHYVFSTPPLYATNIDHINGFSAADDNIELLDTIFTNLPDGQVLPQNFAANATGTAVDANDFLVYNTTNGALSYDSNGSAAGGLHQFAVLTGIPTISAADFEVVNIL